ncbi:hypothetical protein DI270_004365 [Microbispora triticiradicis]|uniref:Uncharacterized protein n=3 Tax=Microbispora TaxID=2005 RepID=A0ABY3LSX8_9ACTN|nr:MULTISPECIES: hypothetical protein [Microbispora]RGA06225.1 hypothetical protein DI270_004365 [Microbispora triticiradicis]TLP63751.1 hypothetical protein FED44_05725 [Microbispora fusca]TYB52567.1 hypothetical protein FXF59_24595 [Microbispora tritici]
MKVLDGMWQDVPVASFEDLTGARRRLMDGMHARRRVVTAPRLLVAAGVVAAAVATPLVAGGGTPAYAVTENPDGTITVALDEMRDPEGLQADLLAAGVTADVSFLAPHTRCADPRFEGVDPSYGSPGHTEAQMRAGVERWRSFEAAQVVDVREIRIRPEFIRPGETLVLEFRDNQNAQRPWRLGAWLARAGSPVKPCTPVPDAG